MTDSLTRTLKKFGEPSLVARYLPGLTAQDFDALTQGAMFMTEQGAGSDVGGVITRAVKDGDDWRLYGDKWFCSNADAGTREWCSRAPTAPRRARRGWRSSCCRASSRRHCRMPTGSCGSRTSSARATCRAARSRSKARAPISSAIPERGFVQMTDMINMSRLSNGMRAAGMMRRSLTEALFIARHRVAFGKPLIEMPLMRRQLLKIMLPRRRRARSCCIARASSSRRCGRRLARRRLRILTPLLKFRACRDARRATGDAMEVRGGCGYIEEWSDPRLVRDAHLGSIWEGTSNVVALDVMRAIRREGALDALQPALEAMAPEGALGDALRAAIGRAAAFAAKVARERNDVHARQSATGLYYAVAGSVLASEGTRLAATGDARRLLLAALVVEHRLQPATRSTLRRKIATQTCCCRRRRWR
jgi:alkylation response protein AidB-like acyl-CoA dehydrogenase